jgi:hypothetical protein
MNEIEKDLDALANRDDPPSAASIKAARKFGETYFLEIAEWPEVDATGDGCVQFVWQEGRRVLIVEFRDSRTARYMRKTSDDNERGGECSLSNAVKIEKLLQWVFGE